MRKFLLSSSLALTLPIALLPGLAFAAYNDVSLTTSTILSVGGISLNVSGTGGTLETIAVGSSSFTITLQSASSLDIVATGRNLLAVSSSSGSYNTPVDSCNASQSELKITSLSSSTTTVTITPSTSTCTSGGSATTAATASSSSSSGSNGAPASGGGGGGGATIVPGTTSTSAAATTDAQVAQLRAQIQSLLAQLAALTGKATPSAAAYANANENASFKRDLSLGATGADVKALQVYLNAHGFAVSKSGAGSPGNETTKFGSATKKALAKLQASVGIKPANGNFGPKTRAYISSHP